VKQACVTQKSAFLASYLIAWASTTHHDHGRRFQRAPSAAGQYNTYWIHGRWREARQTDLTRKYARPWFRGDALILDDVHDERKPRPRHRLGTKVHGKLSVLIRRST